MEKFNVDDPKHDIATEKYQGPGKLITSAGYMYVSHAASMLAGFLGLGAAGAVAHEQTHKIKHWAETLSESHAEQSGVKKIFAQSIATVSKFAEQAAHKIASVGSKLTKSSASASRMGEVRGAAFLFAGGFGAILGYALSTVWGAVKGSHEGERGRQQFERAQQEISHLRETNDNLERINDQIREKYIEASTKWKNREQADAHAIPSPTANDSPAIAGLHAAKHDGKLAAEPAKHAVVA